MLALQTPQRVCLLVSRRRRKGLVEGSKDEPGEQASSRRKLRPQREDTSPPPAPPEVKGAAAPEGEKATEKDGRDKPEAQVSSRQSEVGLDPEADGTGACLASVPRAIPACGGQDGCFPGTASSLPHRSQVRKGRRLRCPSSPGGRKEAETSPEAEDGGGDRGGSWSALDLPDLPEDQLGSAAQK